MAVADPVCVRCGERCVWIGIGPGANAVCKRECSGKCPRCLSTAVEPFVRWSYWSLAPQPDPDHKSMHCLPCGNVWEEP